MPIDASIMTAYNESVTSKRSRRFSQHELQTKLPIPTSQIGPANDVFQIEITEECFEGRYIRGSPTSVGVGDYFGCTAP